MSKLTRRITAMLLSGMLIIGSVPGSVLAASTDVDPGQTSETALEVYDEEISEAPAGEGETAEIEETSEASVGSGETTQVEDTSEAPVDAGKTAEIEDTSEEPAAMGEMAGSGDTSGGLSAEEEATVQYYTVTLDANGGYFENEWDDAVGDYVERAEVIGKQIPVGGTVAAVPVFSNQDGQTMLFAGWSLERDGELVSQAEEEYTLVDNCVLYAVWQADETEDASQGETVGQEVADESTGQDDAVQGAEEAEDASEETVTAEEETQPELNDSFQEEETVREDAANGVMASGTCGANLTWTLDEEGTLIISGTGEMDTKVDYKKWSWYSVRLNIKTVIVEYGATTIGRTAFAGCSNITNISIPNSVTTIDIAAFNLCSSLTDVYYYGSENNWNEIIIYYYYNDPLSSATIHFVSGIDVSLEEEDQSQQYIGSEIRPVPVVKGIGGKILIEGLDYTLAYENNRTPGTARIIATGIGDYEGLSGEAEFMIQGAIRAELTQNLFPAEGKEVKAPIKVWWEEVELEEGTDYALSYNNNSAPGTASVVVTGTGYYTGTVQLDYTIAATQGLQEKYEYTGDEICPVFSLVTGAKTLIPETDYTLSYEGNINPGPLDSYIKVQGKGTYKGSFKIPFSIVPRKVGGLTAKTFTQREMRLSFRDLECAEGYRIRWWTEEDPDTIHEFDVENTRTENADNGLFVKEDENHSGINMAYYEGKESLPRAKRIVVQVSAYANMATDDPAVYEKSFGEYSDPVTFASGNQVIRKEMWGFTNNGESRDPSRQVEVSGVAHAEILTHINQSDGQCAGMCWAGAYSVQYGNSFGTDTLQNITSSIDSENYRDNTLGMTAQEAIEYAQAINHSEFNAKEELAPLYVSEDNLTVKTDYFQYMYNSIKNCQDGHGDSVFLEFNGKETDGKKGYNHAILAMGISYEDDYLVQIDVYDPNIGNKSTNTFELYKDKGSLIGDDVSFAYINSEGNLLSGRLGDFGQLFAVDRVFFRCINQNLRILLEQVRDHGILTDEDSILFCYAPANNQDDYIFEMIEGDSAVTIDDSYSPDGSHLMFRVSNTKGKILKIKSRKATIRFGIKEIEYEIILKLDEPCEILINIDNPSYPDITITQTGTGTDIGWMERRFENGKAATTNMNLGVGTDGTMTILPQADNSTVISGIASISAVNLNGTFDGSGTVTENETTSMPVTTLTDNMEYNYSLHKDSPLLRQINSDGTDQTAIVFHIHDWNDWKTTQTPTVTAEGKMERGCSLCGQKETKSIAKLPNLNNAKVTGLSGKTYTGKACTQSPKVSLNDKVLKKDTDYSVSYKNNINAGTASMILIGKGNYGGRKTVNFTISKASQSITVKAATSSVAVGKTTTVSLTGNKGSKSFKSSDTSIATVTSAGKVTAKKVGTVKITATSAATANYKAVSKTVTIKVVPAATASLTAANQATGIKLTWKKVTGANGYKVYRGSTLIKSITSGSTVTFADTKANTNGTKYTYKVVAKATTGDSTLSKSWVIYRVSRPTVSSATNSASKKMTVKWGKNAKANGYQIQYSTDKTFKSGNKAVSPSRPL